MAVVSWIRGAVVVALAAVASSCSVERQAAPELSGPSELAQSVAIAATPDRLVQDGASQTVVSVIARDHQAKPIVGLRVRWQVDASDGQRIETADGVSVTDAQGRASTRITAPPAPVEFPPSPVRLTILALPVGGDTFSGSATRVIVELVPPAGTPNTNRNPVAAFSVVPVVANVNQSVTFDASTTTDEGAICGAACSYLWDFGDFTTDTGATVSHKYTLPRVYTITLTVVDVRGGVGSTSRSLTVNGPTPPVAQFTAVPAAPTVGATVTFDATLSSVGAGATITSYQWTIDGGAAVSSTTPVYSTTFSTSGSHTVILVVTDSLGRTATRVATVTVT